MRLTSSQSIRYRRLVFEIKTEKIQKKGANLKQGFLHHKLHNNRLFYPILGEQVDKISQEFFESD